ncbi:DUF2268 domain-containing putative Zn-dependent protease [Sphingosinicella sp. CPCC 101087]|uniref:DUF2268 domain-containing putative Zn-dependent protease n=1 Tax=Sphingosinicella sp. CPCC 101087 TaxID=2497754 RepID=UPI00101C8C85|nr:DUF2268 domain-containing putative Zn-dependent protease [Sphingosinicella sp. CPCC 101087]
MGRRPEIAGRRRIGRAAALGAALALAATACAAAPALRASAPTASPAPDGPVIEIDDVRRFYDLYDATGGRPSAEQLQRDYLDRGSEGLGVFIRARNTTAERIAEAIATRPALYADARRCEAMLPRVRLRAAAALAELRRLYPEARLPPVTLVIGRGRPMAIGSPATGVQIGLEVLCGADFINPNIEDLFVRVIAHEYVHVQQVPALVDGQDLTVLEASVMEGAAEFVTERLTGDIGYAYLRPLVAGRELEIETAFVADMDKKDLSDWLFNTTPERPGDLGYWVGYRIAKAYYQNAADKDRALRDILQVSDARAFLAASGWRPGITLDR